MVIRQKYVNGRFFLTVRILGPFLLVLRNGAGLSWGRLVNIYPDVDRECFLATSAVNLYRT